MQEENGHRWEGNAQGVVIWIVVFAVAAIVPGFCAKHLFDWATGNGSNRDNRALYIGPAATRCL